MRHRADIDGLRAVAVLSVIGFHAGARGFRGGFAGVDVFFVISGYLICAVVLRDLDRGAFSFRDFYLRRCKRILPALVTVLIVCMAAAMFLLSPYEARQLGSGVLWTALSASNVAFWRNGNYFDHGGILNPLLMTWSLAVEEQFYVVFPVLAVTLFRRGRVWLPGALVVCCGASLALCIHLEFRHPSLDFYSPVTRAWEIGAGTVLAVYQSSRRVGRAAGRKLADVCSCVGLAMVLGCVCFYSPAVRFPGYEAIPVVAGTVLLLASDGAITNRVLEWRPLVLVGLISYSLYLWHWPLLSFAAIIDSEHTSGVGRALLMLLAAVLATGSYLWIETPFRTARQKTAWTGLRWYLATVACVALLGAGMAQSYGVKQRAPALAEVERSLALGRSHECIHFADQRPDLSPGCVPPPSSKMSVALLGDSHAEALEATLREKVQAGGEQLLAITAYSCPPLKDVTRYLLQYPQHAWDCARFNQRALEIVAGRPDVKKVVLSGSWAMLPDDRYILTSDRGNAANETAEQSAVNVVAGIAAEIRALEASGKRVIVIDDWPSLPIVPMDGARYAGMPVRAWVSEHLLGHPVGDAYRMTLRRTAVIPPAAEAVRSGLLRLAKNDPSVQFVDAKQILCSAAECRFGDGGELFYTDAAHISSFGASEILRGVDCDKE